MPINCTTLSDRTKLSANWVCVHLVPRSDVRKRECSNFHSLECWKLKLITNMPGLPHFHRQVVIVRLAAVRQKKVLAVITFTRT